MKGPAVVIRTAGSPAVGFGHLRRCWTLADHLRGKGTVVRFAVFGAEASAILRKAGFESETEPDSLGLEATIQLLNAGPETSLCILDDPEIGSDRMSQLSRRTPTLCLDDTGERGLFPVEMVSNGSAGAQKLTYRGKPDTLFLLGPDFILLRAVFAAAPDRREPSGPVRRLLLMTGGGNGSALASRLAGGVLRAFPEIRIDLISGPLGENPFTGNIPPERVSLYTDPENLRSLMLAADLAISAGGQTCYELAATATPAIGLLMAENQSVNLQGLEEAGCLINLGKPDAEDFTGRLNETILRLSKNSWERAALGSAGRRLVDGRGTERLSVRLAPFLKPEQEARTG